jgi:hypothetical protein
VRRPLGEDPLEGLGGRVHARLLEAQVAGERADQHQSAVSLPLESRPEASEQVEFEHQPSASRSSASAAGFASGSGLRAMNAELMPASASRCANERPTPSTRRR